MVESCFGCNRTGHCWPTVARCCCVAPAFFELVSLSAVFVLDDHVVLHTIALPLLPAVRLALLPRLPFGPFGCAFATPGALAWWRPEIQEARTYFDNQSLCMSRVPLRLGCHIAHLQRSHSSSMRGKCEYVSLFLRHMLCCIWTTSTTRTMRVCGPRLKPKHLIMI